MNERMDPGELQVNQMFLVLKELSLLGQPTHCNATGLALYRGNKRTPSARALLSLQGLEDDRDCFSEEVTSGLTLEDWVDILQEDG